ncbi:hypothetical protein Ancab_001449 [Ancistrocladus abbreviatus]
MAVGAVATGKDKTERAAMMEKGMEVEESGDKERGGTPLVGLNSCTESKLGVLYSNDNTAENQGERSTGGSMHSNYAPLDVDDSQRHMEKFHSDMEATGKTMGHTKDEETA